MSFLKIYRPGDQDEVALESELSHESDASQQTSGDSTTDQTTATGQTTASDGRIARRVDSRSHAVPRPKLFSGHAEERTPVRADEQEYGRDADGVRLRLFTAPANDAVRSGLSVDEIECDSEADAEADADVLPFAPVNRLREPLPGQVPVRRVLDSVTRARIMHENRFCPFCDHSGPEPIELRDALYTSNLLPVPGTATLVGFHCSECDSEWPI